MWKSRMEAVKAEKAAEAAAAAPLAHGAKAPAPAGEVEGDGDQANGSKKGLAAANVWDDEFVGKFIGKVWGCTFCACCY